MLLVANDAHPGERTTLACLPDRFPPGARAILDLAADGCRWPQGEVSEETFAFCGERRTKGSYCATHAGLSRRGRR